MLGLYRVCHVFRSVFGDLGRRVYQCDGDGCFAGCAGGVCADAVVVSGFA